MSKYTYQNLSYASAYSPLQLMQEAKYSFWSDQEKQFLIAAVLFVSKEKTYISWKQVSEMMKTRTVQQCKSQYLVMANLPEVEGGSAEAKRWYEKMTAAEKFRLHAYASYFRRDWKQVHPFFPEFPTPYVL